MLGIILAGGEGRRCYPTTLVVSKHLLPVYDKPMIYYSIALLLECDIKDIVVITTSRDVVSYKGLFGDGTQFGINLRYIIQDKPLGTAHAVMQVKQLIDCEGCVLIYGDNYISSEAVKIYLKENKKIDGATIFAYKVENPENYGVIEISETGKVISLEEKPRNPKSYFAMIGLICLDKSVCEKLDLISLSERKEYEITDVLNIYMDADKLDVVKLENGAVWSDLGNSQSITELSYQIMVEEKQKGLKIGCIEEVALDKGLISTKELSINIKKYGDSVYGRYLKKVLEKNGGYH